VQNLREASAQSIAIGECAHTSGIVKTIQVSSAILLFQPFSQGFRISSEPHSLFRLIALMPSICTSVFLISTSTLRGGIDEYFS
jgi:coenzyme F420-reducing hydrogenase gamma subunit